MKALLLLPVFLFLCAQVGYSQDESAYRKNLLMMEAGGPIVFGLGAGYERYLHVNQKLRSSLRVGAGLVDSFQKVSFFGGGSILWGGTSAVELGANYLVNYDQSVIRSLEESESQFDNGYQLLIGYRYQARKGFLGRIYWVVPVGCCGSSIPVYSGLSLGYAF